MGRQHPFKRASSKHPLHLQQAAQAAVAAVSQLGPMTGDQVRQLIWPKPSQKSYGDALLRRLFDAAYLDRIPFVDGFGPARILYVLGPVGRRVEAHRLGVSASALGLRPAKQRGYKPLFLSHHLATVQVVINLRLAAERLKGALVHYASDRELRRLRVKGTARLPVVPDAFATLTVRGNTQSFLVELDRATKTTRLWQSRFDDYWHFQTTTTFERDYKSPAILIVIDAPRSQAERRIHALKGLVDANAQRRDTTLFWLTALADASPAAILSKPIWQVGGREGHYSLLPPDREQGGTSA